MKLLRTSVAETYSRMGQYVKSFSVFIGSFSRRSGRVKGEIIRTKCESLFLQRALEVRSSVIACSFSSSLTADSVQNHWGIGEYQIRISRKDTNVATHHRSQSTAKQFHKSRRALHRLKEEIFD
ncbi:hypothetical protein VNO77_28316 [Canavalia gladiata]|uniref:Uncharacterized protein n=1 Tax=Canavalia gladiata TaxID=3824 RepID=A0AAN9KVG7_CANGL